MATLLPKPQSAGFPKMGDSGESISIVIGNGEYEQDIVMSPISDTSTLIRHRSPETTPPCAQLDITPSLGANLFKPAGNLPDCLMTQLQEWHENYPSEKPVFSCGGPRDTMDLKPWKVVDRDYRAAELQRLRITKQGAQPYYVLALRLPDGLERFVGCYQLSRLGTLLYAWLGLSQGFERDPCAIRRRGTGLDEIHFPPGLWDRVPDVDLNYMLRGTIQPSLLSANPPASDHEPSADSGSDEEQLTQRRKSRQREKPSLWRRQSALMAGEGLTAATQDEEYQQDMALPPTLDASTLTPSQSSKTLQCCELVATPYSGHDSAWGLSNHLVAQLQEWYESYPLKRPPFLHGSSLSDGPMKVIDRDHRAVDIQRFKISKQGIRLCAVVLRLPNGLERFVRGQSVPNCGTYLYAWLGLDQGFEREPCAIRRFGKSLDTIQFPPMIWEDAPDIGQSSLLHEKVWRPNDHQSSMESEGDEEWPVEPRKGARLKKNSLCQRSSRRITGGGLRRGTRDKHHRAQEPAQNNGQSSSASRAASTSQAANTGSRVSAKRPMKAPQQRQARTLDSESRVTTSRGVRFKFICIRTQQSSVSTVRDGESLFFKGKRFFQESNPEVKVNKLICYVPYRNELRNLYDDEYQDASDFIDELREYQESTGNTEAIEVRYQLG